MNGKSGEQPTLAGFGPPDPVGSLFFAVMPDAEARGKIAALVQALRAGHGLRGQAIAPERLHVTLQYLGEFAGLPADLVAGARRAGDALDADAFDLAFDGIAGFGAGRGRRPLVLRGGAAGTRALVSLYEALAARLAAAGVKSDTRHAFVPHLTLLYDERLPAPQAIDPVGWRVRELHLLRGLAGAPCYEPLASWTLRR
ncbi:2'-5' RNA ligase family protein [Luteimonas aquatica]|uniref:2'-5' RNA ligase family protein n=1 Tax=Luteimonas aquatica TaxID=450364 RepID=UPI001F59489F|nr:2'-5' RNA ligase family protein [Luteimonas aquatica]